MKFLFLAILFLLTFSQVVNSQSLNGNEIMLISESQCEDQGAEKNNSSNNYDEEIAIINSNCHLAILIIQPEETIFTHTIKLKSSFLFSFWRPPRF